MKLMAGTSTLLKIVAVVIVAVIIVAAVYVTFTFPKTDVEFSVSFTIGLDREQREFNVPWLHDKAQVEVTVTNGSSLWRASITNATDYEIWYHLVTFQGEQTTYTSEWITIPPGSYNLTYVIAATPLDATIRVISKGGIW